MLAASGPQLVISGWIPWVVALGSVTSASSALVVFFRKIVFPLAEVVTNDIPVLVAIAETYGSEGREILTDELRRLVAHGEAVTAVQKKMLDRLDAIDDKLRATRHDVIGVNATLKAWPAGESTLIERLAKVAEQVQEITRRLDHPPEGT